MKKVFFILVHILLITCICSASINKSIAHTIDSAKTIEQCHDNYLSSAIISPTKIVKWNKMPISVFIEENKYKNTTIAAFKEWEDKTANIVSFVWVNKLKDADISVNFIDKFKNLSNNKYYAIGLSKPYYRGNDIIKAEITIALINPKTNKPVPDGKIYAGILHEIGHALGIVGHSPNEQDIMYQYTKSNYLTSNDINTLKLIYSPNINKLNLSDKIPEEKIKEVEKITKEFPNNPISWIKYGDLYRNYNQYKEAIGLYKKALKIDKKNSQAYYSIGVCNYKLHKLQESLNYIEKALALEPENTIYINSYIRVCIKLHKKDKAKNYLDNVINKNPKLKEDRIIQDSLKILSYNKH